MFNWNPGTPVPNPNGQTDSGLQAPDPMAPTQHAQAFGVSPQQVQQYMLRGQADPRQAAIAAAVDMIWAEVAKQYGILNGDAAHDKLLWQEHWGFTQGESDQDPLHDNPDAMNELQSRVMDLAGKVMS